MPKYTDGSPTAAELTARAAWGMRDKGFIAVGIHSRRSNHSTGLPSPFDPVAATASPLIADDRLREAYMALVVAMVVPVTGFGSSGNQQSG